MSKTFRVESKLRCVRPFRDFIATRRGAWGLIVVGTGVFFFFGLTKPGSPLGLLWLLLHWLGFVAVVLGVISLFNQRTR